MVLADFRPVGQTVAIGVRVVRVGAVGIRLVLVDEPVGVPVAGPAGVFQVAHAAEVVAVGQVGVEALVERQAQIDDIQGVRGAVLLDNLLLPNAPDLFGDVQPVRGVRGRLVEVRNRGRPVGPQREVVELLRRSLDVLLLPRGPVPERVSDPLVAQLRIQPCDMGAVGGIDGDGGVADQREIRVNGGHGPRRAGLRGVAYACGPLPDERDVGIAQRVDRYG